jgi:catalase
MSKKKTPSNSKGSAPRRDSQLAVGVELHQVAGGGYPALTTNQGVSISDNQNSLKAIPRGSTLLENFILREKITHFDHERIPERIRTSARA